MASSGDMHAIILTNAGLVHRRIFVSPDPDRPIPDSYCNNKHKTEVREITTRTPYLALEKTTGRLHTDHFDQDSLDCHTFSALIEYVWW